MTHYRPIIAAVAAVDWWLGSRIVFGPTLLIAGLALRAQAGHPLG